MSELKLEDLPTILKVGTLSDEDDVCISISHRHRFQNRHFITKDQAIQLIQHLKTQFGI